MRLLPFLLLLPAVSAAQTITLNFADASTDTRVVGPNSCDARIAVTYDAVAGIALCERMEIWASAGGCETTRGDAPLLASLSNSDFLNNAGRVSGTLDVHVAALPIFNEVACADYADEAEVSICASFKVTQLYGDCLSVQSSTEPVIVFDALPPPRPVIESVVSMDSALRLRVPTAVDVRLFVDLALAEDPEAPWVRVASTTTSGQGVTVSHLENDVRYRLRVIAEDAALNVSEPSEVVEGTPIATQGFWGDYKDKGGSEVGCSAAGSGPLSLLALLALLWRRRS
jgi:Synergist-CTERM protein sorting domain-containing protein